ncbi:TetR/AcrR family transcriptional regulator [Amycolatopsis sp.]|uniref:TetR/AcrR family transcriptional regulator n=1 Tax=Amycolatopsis sp. TaxID=37632 RepID=UPI002E01644A|nr:TetR/AcrR family transcriptional regulator [Amycolatopsis sp.]
MGKRGSYHHGDLRAALVDAALALIAERGIEALSVAEVARRTEVSPAAPYRHFPTREALLQATAIRAAELLAAELREALDDKEDPGEALAIAAGVYVRFVCRHHAGMDLIFSDELRNLGDPALTEAGRAVTDILLPIGMALTGNDAEAALALLRKNTAAAHGYAVLFLSGFLRRRSIDIDDIAAEAADTSRILAAAAKGGPPSR